MGVTDGPRSHAKKFEMDFISSWKDDERMGFLFSPFPSSRSIHFQHWESKMTFWTTAIEKWANRNGTFVLSLKQLEEAFSRKKSKPACLKIVLEEMEKAGRLKREVDYFSPDRKGWFSWGYDHLSRSVGWIVNKATGKGLRKALPDDLFIVEKSLKDKASSSVRSICDSAVYLKSRSGIISVDEFERLVANYDSGLIQADCFPFLIVEMTRQKTLVKCDDLNAVKVSRTPAVDGVKVTDTDIAVYRLQQTELKLQTQISEMNDKTTDLKSRAKVLLGQKKKHEALGLMRRSKVLERSLIQCEAYLNSVQLQLDQFEGVASNKMMLDTFSASSAALKKELRQSGLTVDHVENVLGEVEEALADCADINEAMSTGNQLIDATDGCDVDELEAELAELTLSEPERMAPSSPVEQTEQEAQEEQEPPDAHALPAQKTSQKEARHTQMLYAN